LEALKHVDISEEAEKLMLEELEKEMILINEYLQKEEDQKEQEDENVQEEKSFETPVKKKKESAAAAVQEEEFSFFYETPNKKKNESDDVEFPVKANEETPKVTKPEAPKQLSIEVQKRIQKIIDAVDKSSGFYKNIFKGDPNSITYKLMAPHFPEHVKKGLKVSVQGRLGVAKERLSSGSSTSASSTSPPCADVPYKNLQ
jgi:hypothetical protein